MMVAIADGHGKIALRLTCLPASSGTDVIRLICNPAHAADAREAGALASWAASPPVGITARRMAGDTHVLAHRSSRHRLPCRSHVGHRRVPLAVTLSKLWPAGS